MNGVLGFHNVVLGSSRKGRKVVFFDNFMGIVRVFVVGSLAYVTLIVLLRFSGNRTLSKMNAFDFHRHGGSGIDTGDDSLDRQRGVE